MKTGSSKRVMLYATHGAIIASARAQAVAARPIRRFHAISRRRNASGTTSSGSKSNNSERVSAAAPHARPSSAVRVMSGLAMNAYDAASTSADTSTTSDSDM